MKRWTIRFAGLLTLFIGLMAATPASALPTGLYLIGCRGGQYGIWNLLGKQVASLAGPCAGNYLERMYVSMMANPPQPSLTPALHPCWEGKTAWQWIAFINTCTMLPPESAPTISLEGVDPDALPTLSCDVAHFSQVPPQ